MNKPIYEGLRELKTFAAYSYDLKFMNLRNERPQYLLVGDSRNISTWSIINDVEYRNVSHRGTAVVEQQFFE